MCCLRFTMASSDRKEVECQLKTAQHLGNLRQVQYFLAILAVMDGQSFAQVALILRVHEKTVASWICAFCCYGLQGAPHTKPTGRPPKLTPTQQEALAPLIEEGTSQGRVQRRLLAFAHDAAVALRPLRDPLQCLLYRPVAQEPGLSLAKSGCRLGSSS